MTDRLSPSDFLTHLTTLLASTHSAIHGSIYLTQKPLPPVTSSTSPTTDAQTRILIRATNGAGKRNRVDKKLKSTKPKVKLSTEVEVAELEVFYTRYAEVCKKGMEGLRKRDRKAKAGKKKKGKKAKGEKGGG